MKRLGFIAVFAMLTFVAEAQEPKFAPIDASPADIVYFPLNAAKVKDGAMPAVKVVFSRPSRKGRDIFGILEQYGKIWRVGANESTEIKFFKRVKIDGKTVKAGTYSLFAIPERDKWTLIINKQTDRWGAFSYNPAKDVIRVDVPVKKLKEPLENFSMTFTTQPQGANMVLAWDRVLVELPIAIN